MAEEAILMDDVLAGAGAGGAGGTPADPPEGGFADPEAVSAAAGGAISSPSNLWLRARNGVSVDPRAPVLIGVGQVNQRTDRGDPAKEPVDLIVDAARAAALDGGARGGDRSVVAAIGSVRIVSLLSWRYRDPGALVAERLGIDAAHTVYTTAGGNTPQALLSRTALDIQRGRADMVLIGGAESWRTRMSLRGEGTRPDWTVQDDAVRPSEEFGGELQMHDPIAAAHGIALPVQVYPMFEQALRAAEGRSLEDHLVRISELWARFSAVAAKNPAAWIQREFTAEEIRTPGPDNRLIGFPYPKLMNSNNAVEQAAALLMCSAETAERLGVPRDRWVFPQSGADAHDMYVLSERGDLHTSPAIRVAGARAVAMAGAGIDDIGHVDLYSCFPSAVEVAANELGLAVDDAARPLTVTGGLSFAGGPWNNYVTHSIATMVGVLREDPRSLGMCTANGGFLTKHAIGVYGTEPPAAGFRWADVQDEVDAVTKTRQATAEYDDDGAVVESWTVMHDRDGTPETGFASVLLPDGRRSWATTRDPGVLESMTVDDLSGRLWER